MDVIRSPVLRPPRAAGLPAVKLATNAPVGRLSPILSAISEVTVCRCAPSHGRVTALPPPLARAAHPLDHMGRDREADPLRPARAREDGGVDADQAARSVDQRPAG